MPPKKQAGQWSIVNVATVIIAIPIVCVALATCVKLWYLPDQVDTLSEKVKAIQEQVNSDTHDLHNIKRVLHLDGDYVLITNAFNLVKQSTHKDTGME